MLNFNDYLDNEEAINEGVYDKNIFKCFFLQADLVQASHGCQQEL